MTEKLTFIVETLLPLETEIATTEVTVEISGNSLEDLQNRLEVMPELVAEARKNIASRHVTYEAYSGDSDYMDALDSVAEGVEIVSIKEKPPEGGKLSRIYFEAEYDDGGGVWGQDAWGVNKEDAVFQGAWAMAVANGHDGKGENIDDLLSFMDVKVLMEYAKPVSEEELIDLLGRLAASAGTGEDLAEIAAEARSAIEAIAANKENPQWQEAGQAALEIIDGTAPSNSPAM